MSKTVPHSSSQSAIWLDLVGANQGWLERCRAAVSKNPTAIAELADDDSPAAYAIRAADTRTVQTVGDDPFGPRVSYDWQVATAVRSLTLALASQIDPEEGADAILRHVERAGLNSAIDGPHGRIPTPPQSTNVGGLDGPAMTVLREVMAQGQAQTTPFAELLILSLTKNFPKTAHSVTVPVVFAGDARDPSATEELGVVATGKLTVELLSEGPSGLHPNPAMMCFARTDQAFIDSVTSAWKLAPPELDRRCVIWTLRLNTNAAQPLTAVKGGSLGASFFVALHELAGSTIFRRVLRARSYDPRCVITAAVSSPAGTLSSVTGLDQKVSAARRANFRLIVAQSDLALARQTTNARDLHIIGAATIRDAVRLSRGHLNRRFRYISAATVTLTLVLATVSMVLITNNKNFDEQQRIAAQEAHTARMAADKIRWSQQLASRSGELLRSNPRYAGVVALAAHEMNPSPQTIQAMNAAINNDRGQATVGQGPKKSYDIAIAGKAVWFSTSDGIRPYSLTTLQPITESHPTLDSDGDPVEATIAVNSQEDRLAAIGFESIVIYSIDRTSKLTETYRTPSSSDFGYGFGNFSSDGRHLIVTGEEGDILTVDLDTERVRKNSSLKHIKRFGAVNEVVDEPGKTDWSVLFHVTTTDRTHGFKTELFRFQPDIDRLSLITSSKGWNVFSDVAVSRSGLIFAAGHHGDTLRTLMHDRWQEYTNISSDGVNTVAISEQDQVAVSAGSYISLFNRQTQKLELLHRAAEGRIYYYLKWAGPSRVIAVDESGQMIVVGTPSQARPIETRGPSDTNPSGEFVASAKGGPAITVRQKDRGAVTAAGSRVYEAAPPKDLGKDGFRFSPTDVVLTENLVGVAGQAYKNSRSSRFGDFQVLAAVWKRAGHLLFTDRCEDPNFGNDALVAVTPDERTVVVSQGATLCRWSIPSGERLPNIDLAPDRDEVDSREPYIFDIAVKQDRALVVADDNRDGNGTLAYLVDLRTGEFRDVPGTYIAAAISPDGESVATISIEGVVTLTALEGSARPRVMTVEGTPDKLAWSPDGSRLAVLGSNASSLTFIDIASGLQDAPAIVLLNAEMEDYDIPRLTWEQPNTLLASGERNYSIQLSQLPSWKQALCLNSNEIDPRVWHVDVASDVPFQDPCK